MGKLNRESQTPPTMSSQTNVKAHELRNKSKQDMLKQLDELKMELHKLRVAKVASSNSSKLTKISDVRKSIARIHTIMTQKTREAIREQTKKDKYTPLDMRAKKTRALRRKMTKHEANQITLRQKKK